MQKHNMRTAMVYANLKAEMIKRDIHINTLASHLHLSVQTLLDKIHCLHDFTISEVKLVLEFFHDLDYEYLFNKQ